MRREICMIWCVCVLSATAVMAQDTVKVEAPKASEPSITESRIARQMKTFGYASYYHDRFHGRRMANGDRYHKDSMTCAHLRFPLGTMLRIKNMRTGKEIEVEVTDRGPYSKKFVVDLSRGAARALGIIGAPLTKVELTPIGNTLIPFRIAKLREESLDSIYNIYDLKPFGEQEEKVWEGDSILRRVLDLKFLHEKED
ncbi:MAG: septal ring lytic transglycosylase RlpA family protein [Bacteroidaceae bacterium]|nr:septal ring lytic transglycosylase RlpA family protein [Bacteroidaceae bacterium]